MKGEDVFRRTLRFWAGDQWAEIVSAQGAPPSKSDDDWRDVPMSPIVTEDELELARQHGLIS